ncbi:MAG: FKBP-type peptidyl-prolyl cis-trans isomerase [Chloroherpetonaceae bacterium]|nr:FKBP-type peptidyl-prolyl cis-trans isomerase [Chloroherpetonaceae bacterium]
MNVNKNKFYFLIIACLLFISSCGTNPEDDLIIEDLVVGTGAEAQDGNSLTVHYNGKLLNGQVFDNSRDSGRPFQFTLGARSVIRGWDLGLRGLRVGGTRRLTIPPELGYGSSPVGLIPANSTLIFEVELISLR